LIEESNIEKVVQTSSSIYLFASLRRLCVLPSQPRFCGTGASAAREYLAKKPTTMLEDSTLNVMFQLRDTVYSDPEETIEEIMGINNLDKAIVCYLGLNWCPPVRWTCVNWRFPF
jgi:hypothetical protein